MEEMLAKGLEDIKVQVTKSMGKSQEDIESLNKKVENFELELKKAEDKGVSVELIKQMQEQMDQLDIKLQTKGGEKVSQPKTLKGAFAGIAPSITKDMNGEGTSFKRTYTMKAASVTFGGAYGTINSTVVGVADPSRAEFYLRNIFASAEIDSEVLQYLRYTGGSGSAAVWNERAGTLEEKPTVDMDFTPVTDNVIWIAALANVHRGMLMDNAFLSNFVPQELTYGERGLLVAENAYILGRLNANSTAYVPQAGMDKPLERVYDAAFGQMKAYRKRATHILMNHRDELKYIALNKATGSGEYDLPIGTVSVIDGKLNIGGVQVIGTPDVPAGTFYVIDSNSGMFFNRLSPEVEVSTEHKDNFAKNMATFRVEERVALMIKDARGIIKGDYTTPGV